VAKVASYYADPTWATMGDKSLAVKLKEDVENAESAMVPSGSGAGCSSTGVSTNMDGISIDGTGGQKSNSKSLIP